MQLSGKAARSIAIGGAIAIIVLLAGLHFGKMSVRMLRAGCETRIINDIVSFAEANSLRMPNDWNEFESWCATQANTTHWKAENLMALYSLPWGKRLVDLDLTNGVLIRILDPSKCAMSKKTLIITCAVLPVLR